jgi:hypothetical protein
VPANFFLFRGIQKQLGGKILNQETSKIQWEGSFKTITKEVFATILRQ